jgi:allantoicase
MKEFEHYPNLASEKIGAKVIFATDDFFAVAENLLLPTEPAFDPTTYTKFGKQMDGIDMNNSGWETRRKRIAGHDWCIIKLGYPGVIRGFDVDTAFFTGNNVPAISIQACDMSDTKEPEIKRVSVLGSRADEKSFEEVGKLNSHEWKTILPISKLKSGVPETRHNYFKIKTDERWTHLRINCFPDGGIARLRVFGNVVPDWDNIEYPCDLACLAQGGKAVQWSNAHYGSPVNLLKPKRSSGMHDGWETGTLNSNVS